MAKLDKLHKQIIHAFDVEKLKKSGIPDNEIKDFERYKLIPIELLVNAAWNYKQNDEVLDKKLGENIKRQGQTENINVRLLDTGYYEVGNGNHRNNVFSKNGRQFVLCCDHEGISDAEFKRRVIEQNESRYAVDNLRIAELISEISNEFDMSDLALTLPFTQNELENFNKVADFDWDDIDPNDVQDVKELESDDVDGVAIKINVTEDVAELWDKFVQEWGKRVRDKGLGIASAVFEDILRTLNED